MSSPKLHPKLLAPHYSASVKIPTTFYAPGSAILEPGVYVVHHSPQHKESGQVVLYAGVSFPSCPDCNVLYELIAGVPDVGERFRC